MATWKEKREQRIKDRKLARELKEKGVSTKTIAKRVMMSESYVWYLLNNEEDNMWTKKI